MLSFRNLKLSQYIIWPILLVVYAGFTLGARGKFLSYFQLKTIIWFALPLGLVAYAEAIVLLSGKFDLSVGQGTGFAAMISAVLLTKGYLPLGQFSIIVPLIIGAILGSLNGFLVGYLSFNPFLATLGTFMAYEGGTLLTSPCTIFEGFPEGYLVIGGDFFVAIIVFVLITIALSILIYKTKFGTHLLGIGSSVTSAEKLGINIKRMNFYTFMLAGVLVGFAALFYTGYVASVPTTLADGSLFLAFGAAVISGISLSGGKGILPNVIGGAILLSLIGSGITALGISPYFEKAVYGIIILLAIGMDIIRRKGT